MTKPPADFEKLRAEIMARYARLSPRLRQVAHFALEHPNDFALHNIAMLASHIGVSSSALIRFAKALDYRGFSDMQTVFRLPLSDSTPNHYSEHARSPVNAPHCVVRPAAISMLRELLDSGIASVEQLVRELSPERLEQAVDWLVESKEVYVFGQRRAFPAAAYLAHALTHLGRHVQVLDGAGGLLTQQASCISEDDLLIVLSFPPYALETADLAADAAARGAAVIAITDSPLDPVAGVASVCFEVHESRVQGLPSLMATLCLIQALVINVGLRTGNKRPSTLKPIRTRTG